MVGKKINARKIASDYARNIAKDIEIEGAMLFGSSALGKMTAKSDIDLIILSRDFSKMPFMKRLQFLNRMRKGPALRVPMDIIGLTPKEFGGLKNSAFPNLRGIYRDARNVFSKFTLNQVPNSFTRARHFS